MSKTERDLLHSVITALSALAKECDTNSFLNELLANKNLFTMSLDEVIAELQELL